MDIEPLLDAIKGLPEEEREHLAVVCHDIARRHPSEHYNDLGVAARKVLGIPEPEPEPTPEPPDVVEFNDGRVAPANPSTNDVTVGITGVEASGKAGGLG